MPLLHELKTKKIESFSSVVQKRIQKIQEALGGNEERFCGLIGVTRKELDRIQTGIETFSTDHLLRLCDNLGISFSFLIEGKIDYAALAAQNAGKLSQLPDRYEVSTQKLSKIRSLQTIFHSLVSLRGSHYAKKIFLRYQVNPHLLADSNAPISILLITDILAELKREGFQDSELRAIGSLASDVNGNDLLGRMLASCNSGKEVYRAMHEEFMAFFDKNWLYRILKLNSEECLIEITTPEETVSIFKNRRVGSREGCLCRQGIYQSILRHVNGRLAHIQELECMYLNSSRCIYRVTWS